MWVTSSAAGVSERAPLQCIVTRLPYKRLNSHPERVKYLRERGFSYSSISHATQVPLSTAKRWGLATRRLPEVNLVCSMKNSKRLFLSEFLEQRNNTDRSHQQVCDQ